MMFKTLVQRRRYQKVSQESAATSLRFASTGAEPDLEQARAALNTALTNLPSHAPIRQALVITLADALRSRGSNQDLREAVTMLEDVEDFGGHSLINLALVLLDLHELDQRESTLQGAVQAAQQAGASTPDPVIKAVYEGTLGKALLVRYQWAYDEADLDRAIELLTRACKDITDDDYLMPMRGELATALALRSRINQRSVDLDRSIALDEETARRLPVDAEMLPQVLQNLSSALCERWEHSRRDEDLRAAAAALHRAERLAKSPEQRGDITGLLGHVHLLRYEAEQEPDDLDASLELLEAAGSARRERRLQVRGDTASALQHRYDRYGDKADLEAAAQLLDGILEDMHVLDPRRAFLVGDWAGLQLARYRQGADRSDLGDAVTMLEKALPATSSGSRAALLLQTNLGIALLLRHAAEGQASDLERARKLLGDVVATTNDETYVQRQRRGNLAAVLTQTVLQTGSLEDLDEALALLRGAVKGAPEASPERAGWLVNLASALAARYDVTGDVTDLEAAVGWARKAVAGSEGVPRQRTQALSQLAVVLGDRYERTNSRNDLDDALTVAEEAAATAQQAGLDRAVVMHNLGRTLGLLYRETAQPDVQARALAAALDAAETTRPGAHGRTTFLVSLALRHLEHHRLTGDPDDLERALKTLETGLEEQPATVHGRGMLLFNLGAAKEERYRSTAALAHLDDALATYQCALATTDAASPLRRDVLAGLAAAWSRRHARTNDVEDLQHTVHALEDLWQHLDAEFVATPVTYKMAQQAAWASTDSALVDAYLDLAASDAGHAAEMQRRAFVVAEGRKSRILAESAARSDLPAPSGVSADLVKREATLLRRLTNMDAVALAEVASVLSPDASDSRAARARQRSVVLRRLTAVWCEIAATGPGGQKYAELRQGNRPTWSSLSQLAEQLGPDTALVSMHTSRQRTVVFVLRTGWSAPTVVSEDMDARRWGDVMDRFSQDVTSFDGTQERRETWLAEPVHVMRRTHSAAGDATRIVLAPDGILHALPWAVALRGANWTVPEGQTPALTTIPALGLMQFLMRSGPPPQLSLVVGDPRDDLPGAREEAVAVARALGTTALLGPDASRKALQAHLSTAGVVHLATHAVFDPEAPLESYIELSDGNYLAREVVESRMVADLVTLSGCESGLSRPLAGEELAGLAYAFLYSGAKALLVSLWQVHDPATALLMSTFYAALQADVDRATALQSAMDDVRANGEYGHTYFWGAFTLVGAF